MTFTHLHCTAMHDAELICRVVAREDSALSELMGRHEQMVRARIGRIVRDSSAVDDLAQETFLRVWLNADQYSGDGDAGAWIGRIAMNLALNHLRSVRRRPAPMTRDAGSESDVMDWLLDDHADPMLIADAAELQERLGDALDLLSAEKQQIQQRVSDGSELRAVAEELGIPLGTAKSRLHHTRKRLAQVWQHLQRQREDI